MGNFTNIYQDVKNLTCRPRDNLTFRKELEKAVSCTSNHIASCSLYSWMFIDDISQSNKQILVSFKKKKGFQAHT